MSVAEWRAALAGLGPTLVAGDTAVAGAMTWQVTIENVAVAIEVVPVARDVGEIRVSVPLFESAATMRIVRPAHALSEDGRLATGDAELDARAWIFADDIAVLGTLDASTRKLLTELVQRGLVVHERTLRLEPWATGSLPGDDIVVTLTRLARLAKALVVQKGSKPYARIAMIAASDPDPAVRATLARHSDASPEVRDANSRLVVKQAKVADEETFESLTTLVRDPATPSAMVREGWVRLVSLFPLERLVLLLENVDKGVADAVITRLTTMASESGARVPMIAFALKQLLEKRAKPEAGVATKAAKIFGKLRYFDAIPWLVLSLDRNESAQLQRAALEALLVMQVPAHRIVDQLGVEGRAMAMDETGKVAAELIAAGGQLGPLLGGVFDLVAPPDQVLYGLTAAARDRILTYLRTFKQLGDPTYADRISQYVSDDGELTVQLAAIDTLGHVGTGKHIALLEPLRKGLFRSGAVKNAATEAIAEIRKRSPNANAGNLSLANDATGGLAISNRDDEDE